MISAWYAEITRRLRSKHCALAHFQYASARDPGIYSFNGNTTDLGLADFLMEICRLFSTVQLPHCNSTGLLRRTGRHLEGNSAVDAELWVRYLSAAQPDNGRLQSSIMGASSRHKSKVYPNAPAGMYFPGDPDFL
jgi:hypothetical protein